MNRQCRYCVHARDNGYGYIYTCKCLLKGKEVSLYENCEYFSDDWSDKENVNSIGKNNRSGNCVD